jgi:hypothetical protein
VVRGAVAMYFPPTMKFCSRPKVKAMAAAEQCISLHCGVFSSLKDFVSSLVTGDVL